jgi:pilus assembly protein CpaC
MVRTVPTRRWWMRYLSLRSWGGVAAGVLVLGVGASLAQSPIVIQRAPRPATPAATTNDPLPASPSPAPAPPAPVPAVQNFSAPTPAPAPAPPPDPLLQLAPPPAPDPAPVAQPVRQPERLPDVPEAFTPPLPSKPNTPPAAPQTQTLPPLPSTPVPAVTPSPASLAVENPGWATKPVQDTKPAPVPPPLPSGMSPTPTATRSNKVSAPPTPEVKPAPKSDTQVGVKAPPPKPPEAKPAAKLPPAPGPVLLPVKTAPPAEAAPVLPAPRLAAEPLPVASAEVQKEYGQFVKSMIDPQTTLDLVAGRPRVMVLADAPKRVQVGDEKVLGFEALPPNELALKPKGIGTTVLNLWFPDPADKNKNKVLSYLVRVLPDPQAKERLRGSYQTLADEINRAFPESQVTLFTIGDKLAVAGQAKDVAQAAQILQIARAHAPDAGAPAENARPVTGDAEHAALTPALQLLVRAAGPNVVNLLRVPFEQQVQLRVTVAEVNRAAARSIGLNCAVERHAGGTIFANRTAQMDGLANVAGGNVPVFLDNGQIGAAIHALRGMNLAKSLAEPNLVALDGQRAEFKAGGEFPVPVAGDCGGRPGVEFRPYGVHLCFTPLVIDHEHIRLTVQAEVSTKDLAASACVGGAAVPGLNTRTFQTTVELCEGQTLAVAGLVQNSFGASAARTPGLSCLPGVGRLFESDVTSEAEQELIVLITPELVRPGECRDASLVPGGDLIGPSDVEFYLTGRLQARPCEECSGPSQRKRFRHCEDALLAGPQGYSDGR